MKDKIRLWLLGWVHIFTGLVMVLTLGLYIPRWVLPTAKWISYQRHKDETK